MRAIPPDFEAATVAAIDAKLDEIMRDERVSIPLAIESGSRAWGFASRDSDYDCRFLYVRREVDYLTPWPLRDVIEVPLMDDLDINGWDLIKAIPLIVKGNAVVLEWLQSPVGYGVDLAFRDALLAFARDHASRCSIIRHHYHLGDRQRRTYFTPGTEVPIKKLFYVLRPAAALRWMRVHPDRIIPPMHFPTLMAECDPPREIARIVDDLIARKAVTRELGAAPVCAEVDRFIDAEFEIAAASGPSPVEKADARIVGNALFASLVRQYSPEPS
ncbi:MAG TPA: nucleotidyltransferase domain-containing protein [Sphingomonas sp.]|nr:nucleotidyltransferase domain-containing protein [Sphingomonas sp.]